MKNTLPITNVTSTDSVIQLPLAGLDLQVPSSRRLLGAYYTPISAADYMADWLVRRDGEHILEPSFGDGIFLRAIASSATRRDFTSICLSGVEIDNRVRALAIDAQLIEAPNARCEDFLGVVPFKVHAVIGNPPYVRLRRLTDELRHRALKVAQKVLGQEMEPSGSLWMPFVLHAMRFLSEGGRLAFVLPYDFTYVRYARPLWESLSSSFGSLRVLRTHERLFPDLLQDVVILLADNYGSSTSTVHYQAFERVNDLLTSHPVVDDILRVEDLLRGERAFINALLEHDLRHLLNTRVAEQTVQARKLVTFNIGYVAGDKEFFHPTDNANQRYQIPPQSLRPTLTSARMIKGAGLRSSSIETHRLDRLFFPNPRNLSVGELNYINSGELDGVSSRYKCRIRDPWYVVPGTRVPDVVLSVFSERPILLVNDIDCFASNSLLCGYCVNATSDEIATGWYTSLTLLQCEIEVHALGGGVMVMVPREAGNVRLPKHVRVQENHISQLDRLLRLGKTLEAYQAGDYAVLMKQLGFTEGDLELIWHGIKSLTHWRTSARSSQQ
jgi:adenine-specific DNA-methyltransferase